jgi:acetyltransferase EpsM
MNKRVLIFGGPGPASVIANAIIHANSIGYKEFEFSGFINDKVGNSSIDGLTVKGGFSDVPKFIDEGYYFLYTIYKIGGQVERIEWFRKLNIPDNQLATFIHPLAYVAPNSKLGPGCVVMPGATISGNSVLGKGCLVMSNASIGHDIEIADHCFFTSNSCLGSWIKVGEGAWVGLNSTIRGRTSIGRYAAIGAGSMVTKDVGDNEIWIGNPAKFHKFVYDEVKF